MEMKWEILQELKKFKCLDIFEITKYLKKFT